MLAVFPLTTARDTTVALWGSHTYFWNFATLAYIAAMPAFRALTMQWLRAKVSTTVVSYTRLRPLYHRLKLIYQASFHPLSTLTGAKVEGKLMQVNDLSRKVFALHSRTCTTVHA